QRALAAEHLHPAARLAGAGRGGQRGGRQRAGGGEHGEPAARSLRHGHESLTSLQVARATSRGSSRDGSALHGTRWRARTGTSPHSGLEALVSRSARIVRGGSASRRSEEHTSELQSRENLVCRLPLEKKKM